jgi:cytochrome P450
VGVKALEDAPFIDVFSAEFRADPGSVIDPLRRETGVIRTPVGASVIRRDLMQALLSDRRLRSSIADLVSMQGVTDGVIHDLVTNSLLANDGPQHARIRKMVNRAFTPRAVDPHRQVIQDILGVLLAPIAARGSCEFMAEVADHYPIQVMCALLGVPDEDHEDFATWNKALTWVLSFELGTHIEEAAWGAEQMNAYVGRLVEERRREPQDDMITALVQVEEAGDRLSDWELRSLIAGLLFAGWGRRTSTRPPTSTPTRSTSRWFASPT